MEDWILVILSSFLSLSIAFFIVYVRDILLDKQKRKEEKKRDLLERRLEKLYSPLYRNVTTCERVLGRKSLYTSRDIDEKGDSWEEKDLKRTISNGFYLASEELQPLLAEYYEYQIANKKKEKEEIEEENIKLVNLIKREFTDLRNKYFEV